MGAPQVISPPAEDLYALDPAAIQNPPSTLWSALRRIGPGMILAASIVGSGELIATTTLGAQVGYEALWVILLSCAIKPVVQAELGRYSVATGETCLESFDHVPGPRFKVNWVVWAWSVMVLMTLLQVGAMFGGVAQVMNAIYPAVPVNLWVVLFLGLTLAILLGGGYSRIEHIATFKVGLFTLLTFLCALLLFKRPDYLSVQQLIDGLKFQLPGAGISTAVAVFGITGVGAAELIMYPYWCVEKGYARFSGARDDSPAWRHRARGWIRVMHLDIGFSLIIYTVSTVAFYLLGAGVLHSMGLVPSASDMIAILSNIYTQILGPWSVPIFYVGAVATLYSTIFASTASNSRAFADMARLLGFYGRHDFPKRVRFQQFFLVILTVIPAILYIYFESPVKMVVVGGICQSIMLPVIGFTAVYLRHRKLPKDIAPGRFTTVGLWVSATLMGATVLYALVFGG